MPQIGKQPAFELGQIVGTSGALAALKTAGHLTISDQLVIDCAYGGQKEIQEEADEIEGDCGQESGGPEEGG